MDNTPAIEEIRAFNRFYTNVLSLMDRSLLQSGFSLAEARVLYEIRRLDPCGAREITAQLNIDEGYLSRILSQFVKKDLVKKEQSTQDKRQYLLHLTQYGSDTCHQLDMLANEAVGAMIGHLSSSQVSDLLSQMSQITKLLRHEPRGD